MKTGKTAAAPGYVGAPQVGWGIAFMTGFAAAWALIEEALGTQFEGRYDLLQVVWCRYAVHILILAAIWGWRDPGLLWRTRRPVFQLVRSLLMFVMPASFVAALYAGAVASSVWAIFWFSPLLLLVLARTVLRERIAPVLWLLVAAGTVAALVILRPSLPSTGLGWLLPMLMALSFSAYVVMTRSLRFEALQANLFYTAFGVLVVLSPFMLRVWTPFSLHDALVFFGIGAVGLLALLMLDRAVAHAPVWVSAPALHLQVVFVLLLGHGDGTGAPAAYLGMAALVIVALVGYLYLHSTAWVTAVAGEAAGSSEDVK